MVRCLNSIPLRGGMAFAAGVGCIFAPFMLDWDERTETVKPVQEAVAGIFLTPGQQREIDAVVSKHAALVALAEELRDQAILSILSANQRRQIRGAGP